MQITQGLAKLAFRAKQQSPNLMFGAGMVGVVTGGVMACRATLKLPATLDEIEKDLNKVKEARETEGTELAKASDYEHRAVVARVYGGSALRLGKLYGPSIVVVGIGIACLTGSHVQLTRRNAALQATAVAIQTAFDNYRERMKEELGEERENAIYRNLDGIDLDKLDPLEEGRNPNEFSPYARVFDESNPHWEPNPEVNRGHIQCQQNYANHLLTTRGFVFLNEVLDVLGFEPCQAGQFVGWVMGGKGDNFVDFGLFKAENGRFVNGLERSVWLDFNVNGVIIDQVL